jgi:predicted glycoside hydrolase/deacetylase ChbG (UPF0249 family)
MKKVISVNADDFGYSDSVSIAILDLIKSGVVSGTSCLVDFPSFLKHKDSLLTLKEKCNIGLHLNLTENHSNTPSLKHDYQSLPNLIRSLYTGCADVSKLEYNIERQLDLFLDYIGDQPFFIDGHQHVHQFKVVRNLLIQAIFRKKCSSSISYIRVTTPVIGSRLSPIKCHIIKFLGASKFKTLLTENSIKSNRAFCGIYNFKEHTQIKKHLKYWVENACDKTMLMCHPGGKDEDDPISDSRYAEYNALKSSYFNQLCADNSVVVKPLSKVLSN